jgi:hypothetical protein
MIYNKEVYDPRTFTWDEWCALMSELFAANQLGVSPEAQWREYADAISGIGRFAGAPGSNGFHKWQDWAMAFGDAVRK